MTSTAVIVKKKDLATRLNIVIRNHMYMALTVSTVTIMKKILRKKRCMSMALTVSTVTIMKKILRKRRCMSIVPPANTPTTIIAKQAPIMSIASH